MRKNTGLVRQAFGILVAVVTLLAGCPLNPLVRGGPPPITGSDGIQRAAGTGPATAVSAQAASLVGRVEMAAFRGDRGIQATIGDVALKATVSLIDPANNETVASTVSDAEGRFRLNFGGVFIPATGRSYILEAVKGLGNNAVGQSAARVRTLLRFRGGWESIAAGGILISRSTTALAAGALLKSAVVQVDLGLLYGILTPGTGDDPDTNYDTIGTVGYLSGCEYQGAWNVVRDALKADTDPVAALKYDASQAGDQTSCGFVAAIPGGGVRITTTGPLGPLFEGDLVTLNGAGFDPDPTANEVRFNGVQATVKSASVGRLEVYAPQLAAGALTLKVAGIVYTGPAYTVQPPLFPYADKLRYVYPGPVGGGNDSMALIWTANPNALGYAIDLGTTPGGNDVMSTAAGKVSALTFATGRTLKGAWQGQTYYATLQPIIPNVPGGKGSKTTQPLQIAEAQTWNGTTTLPGAFRTNDRSSTYPGGYSRDFPGAGVTQFWGHHYFESVDIGSSTTTYVTPFGYVDNVQPGWPMTDARVGNPKDGFLAIHANTISVAGAIDASGRGYGGGPGISTRGGTFDGKGGYGGLSGDGGTSIDLGGWNSGGAPGGRGSGGAGGGSNGWDRGGNGGLLGGGGGGGDIGCGSAFNASKDANNSNAAGGYGSGQPGNMNSSRGGAPPWGGGMGPGNANNSTSGGGGAGYGAGGGGGNGDCTDQFDAGGGGGGTGGFIITGTLFTLQGTCCAIQRLGHASSGLGWAPGVMYGRGVRTGGLGGKAGRYLPGDDTTTDASFVLGSGGAGGDHSLSVLCCWDGGWESTAGAGGGAGGGAIVLDALQSLSMTGALYAVGASGGGAGGDDGNGGAGGGGGGGSGGTVVLRAPSVTVGSTITALGGTDGGNGADNYTIGGNGGDGGAATATGGSIKILADSLNRSGTQSAKRVFIGPYR